MVQKKLAKKKKLNLKKTIRKSANKKIDKSKNVFPLSLLQRSIKQITSNKDLKLRVNEGAAFAFSYFFENIAKDFLKLGFKELEEDKRLTLMPIHIFQGLQKKVILRDSLFKLIKDNKLRNRIAKINTQINAQETETNTDANETVDEDIIEIPYNKSNVRSKSRSKVRSKSRSKARSKSRSKAGSKSRSKSRSKSKSQARSYSRAKSKEKK